MKRTKVDFDSLKGEIFRKIEVDDKKEFIKLHCDDDKFYTLEHYQDCCESVFLEDVCGNINDLLDTPILLANEVTSRDNPKGNPESFTWTFYTLSTIKGTITLRWYGESNGYYSEGVDLFKWEKTDEDIKN